MKDFTKEKFSNLQIDGLPLNQINDYEEENDERNLFPLSSIKINDPTNISLISNSSYKSFLHTPHFMVSSKIFKVECANGYTLSVTVQGDPNKAAIITYHDIGLNHASQFQNFFDYQEMAIIAKRFCVYHIDAPGQEDNALTLEKTTPSDSVINSPLTSSHNDHSRLVSEKKSAMTPKLSAPLSLNIEAPSPNSMKCKLEFSTPQLGRSVPETDSKILRRLSINRLRKSTSATTSPNNSNWTGFLSSVFQTFTTTDTPKNYPTIDGLAEMISDVVKYFKIKSFVGFGVGAGANILSRFALKHPDKLEALFLLEATSIAAGWTEWGYQKLNTFYLRRNSGSLTNFTHEYLIWHHFGKVSSDKNSDIITAFRQYFTEQHINNVNLAAFIESYIKRTDLGIQRKLSMVESTNDKGSKLIKSFDFPVMLVVGGESPHLEESEAFYGSLEPAQSSWLKVSGCSGMVLEERPDKVAEAFRLFLQGLGYIPYLTQSLIQSANPSSKRSEFQKYRSLSTNSYTALYPELNVNSTTSQLKDHDDEIFQEHPSSSSTNIHKGRNNQTLNPVNPGLPATRKSVPASIGNVILPNHQTGRGNNANNKILKVIDIPAENMKTFVNVATDDTRDKFNGDNLFADVSNLDACEEKLLSDNSVDILARERNKPLVVPDAIA